MQFTYTSPVATLWAETVRVELAWSRSYGFLISRRVLLLSSESSNGERVICFRLCGDATGSSRKVGVKVTGVIHASFSDPSVVSHAQTGETRSVGRVETDCC